MRHESDGTWLGQTLPGSDDSRGAAASVITWRKSARSGAQGNCVELARPSADGVLIRNSRFPDGPVLRFSAVEVAGFLRAIKAGEFDELLGTEA